MLVSPKLLIDLIICSCLIPLFSNSLINFLILFDPQSLLVAISTLFQYLTSCTFPDYFFEKLVSLDSILCFIRCLVPRNSVSCFLIQDRPQIHIHLQFRSTLHFHCVKFVYTKLVPFLRPIEFLNPHRTSLEILFGQTSRLGQ